MDKNEIRVKVNGGYLVARKNSNPDYDGIYIVFETNDGDIVDVVLTECKTENDKKKIDVYCYEDVYTEEQLTDSFKIKIQLSKLPTT